MNQEVKNFSRFWTAFNNMPYPGEKEDLKRSLVMQYTAGRTDSLREMTAKEYATLCDAVEGNSRWREYMRKKRSLCLNLMQKIGVDTTSWNRINAFVSDPRIAGKVFAYLDIDDLDRLAMKLRIIKSKGGIKRGETEGKRKQTLSAYNFSLN